ncbi:MAG: mandelate racemase [Armatimonadetes bacterium]|jgi:L-alanine-DL-glutamate epimerase-like enolase superfamily enzyme|nr:mandelate racemase [Armatimonadota bacterium]
MGQEVTAPDANVVEDLRPGPGTPSMKITAIETILYPTGVVVHAGRVAWLWVRIHTDQGVVGLGETFPSGEGERAIVEKHLSRVLLGQDPRDIERLWQDMLGAINFPGWAGAEMRAISAVDIALWDLVGRAAGEPVWRLLGGRCRDRIRTYNTCYDHVYDFNSDAGKLAEDLLQSGIRAMKIWPFDRAALRNRGQYLTREDMEEGLAPVRQIHEAVGDQMEIALEFHGYWNLPSAVKLARALEPFNIMWLEEMLPQDNAESYARLARQVRQPLCLSERLMTRFQFRELIENGAPQFIMPDIAWCGGFTEARKIASLADTYYLPICPHNCGGPVQHAASIHLAAHVPNLFILESVRRHYLKEYVGLVNDTMPAENGFIPVPETPGHGMELDPSVLEREGVEVRFTRL